MTDVVAQEARCSVCGAPAIEVIGAFADLPRVTSDCRPFPTGGKIGICPSCHAVQKPADPKWQSEATSIYSRYDIFRQAAGGAEQRVFDQASGTSLPRSELVLKRLQSVFPFGPTGRALDVGCGNGPTLRAMSRLAPGWQLYGHEISDVNAARFAAIPGFQKLYTGRPGDIDAKFDLITLFHSLEHMPDPVEDLASLRNKLAPGGILLVEVPNGMANFFDLLVADHRSHFDPLSLATAARRAGWPHVAIFTDWAFKELTLLVSEQPINAGPVSDPGEPFTQAVLQQRVDWLASVVKTAREAAAGASRFGVFGTAIAGTWLFGALADKVTFFVDEDPARIGQEHEGRPILSAQQVPAGAVVFVPLLPQVADAVASRLKTHGIDARTPPKLV
ncbi:class I SAM-dependent methyltransferase [Pseudolabrys sp. FHR47]|uniref:class I SAM-dependent methyltransferase n=1 Tax=Pseudolabrys sp. FHR47 TaxID=2562284 RepID=UPI0010BE25D9|nr:class I SAM-dependent methyltransferase [Pseudolabrys sp. FHR47]